MLLSSLAAWDLGYIGLRDFSSRLRNSFDSMGRLERYRGHLLNWYDTQSLTPLQPRYVSTVDSGNLAGALLAFSRGCAEMREAPIIAPARWGGLIDILGDATNDSSATGLWLDKFKVDITVGAGWVPGNDFILFDYDVQGTAQTSFDPQMVDITLTAGWGHNGLVHDQDACSIYLDTLELDDDGDGIGNTYDECAGTPGGTQVNYQGCPDVDGDTIQDACDICDGTDPQWVDLQWAVGTESAPAQSAVGITAEGCADRDKDGVSDYEDQCPGSDNRFPINSIGCRIKRFFWQIPSPTSFILVIQARWSSAVHTGGIPLRS